MKQALLKTYEEALKTLHTFCHEPSHLNKTVDLAERFARSLQAGNKIMICGNGGSACDAMHFAEELTGRYRKDRPPLAALALTDVAHITCVANDFGFAEIFSRSVAALGKSGDWLIALSTSGNSSNIINAVAQAKALHINTLGLLGKTGGQLKGMCDVELIIPADTSDRIQEIHMVILHALVEGIERLLFPLLY